jgi:hypothetical protein
MSRLIERITQPSVKNGEIQYTRWFWRWQVHAKGVDHSSNYLTRMWKDAIRRVPREGVRSILVLGLGVGSCIPVLQKRFRGVSITVIEWDPAMVEVSDRVQYFSTELRPRILVGDVRTVLPELHETFDVVVGDIFDGVSVSEAMRDEHVRDQLRRVLSRHGTFIFNVFREPELFSLFQGKLSLQKKWKFTWNWLAIYRHFGRGTVGDPLPEGYRPARTWDTYVARESSAGSLYQHVGRPECPGMRWHHGPLWFEGYTGDTEPLIDEEAPGRLVTWQPVTRQKPPPGWWRSWLPASPKLTGFAEIREPDAYWKTWSSQMQRHRARWRKHQSLLIEEVSLDEFVANYGQRRMASWLVRLTIQLMKSKVKRHGERVHFFGALDPVTRKMLAGLAVVDVPEASISIHLASFIRPSVKQTSVGVGLIDAWFERCIARGIRFLDFDLFWTFGDPSDWKGFSRFKSQFGITFVRYPRPFFRIVRQKPHTS